MMCTVLFSLAQTHFGPSGVLALHGTKCPLLILKNTYADKVRLYSEMKYSVANPEKMPKDQCQPQFCQPNSATPIRESYLFFVQWFQS